MDWVRSLSNAVSKPKLMLYPQVIKRRAEKQNQQQKRHKYVILPGSSLNAHGFGASSAWNGQDLTSNSWAPETPWKQRQYWQRCVIRIKPRWDCLSIWRSWRSARCVHCWENNQQIDYATDGGLTDGQKKQTSGMGQPETSFLLHWVALISSLWGFCENFESFVLCCDCDCIFVSKAMLIIVLYTHKLCIP